MKENKPEKTDFFFFDVHEFPKAMFLLCSDSTESGLILFYGGLCVSSSCLQKQNLTLIPAPSQRSRVLFASSA